MKNKNKLINKIVPSPQSSKTKSFDQSLVGRELGQVCRASYIP
jgi:hypothetical protein